MLDTTIYISADVVDGTGVTITLGKDTAYEVSKVIQFNGRKAESSWTGTELADFGDDLLVHYRFSRNGENVENSIPAYRVKTIPTTGGLIARDPPSGLIGPLDNVTLTGTHGLGGTVREEWIQTAPTTSGILSTTSVYGPFNITTPDTVFSYRYRATQEITTPAGPVSPDPDRKTRLLAYKQPGTVAMYARSGYGESATGGTNYVTVNNITDLLAEIKIPNNYVIIGSAMDNTVHNLTAQLLFDADNVTLDGFDAPNCWLHNTGSENQGMIRADNIIIHYVGLSANTGLQLTALRLKDCQDVWIDHLEINDYPNDDGIVFGTSSAPNIFKNITISNYHSRPNNFGGVNIEGRANMVPNFGSVTIHNSYFDATKQRCPKNDGTPDIHVFNCVFDDVHEGRIVVDDTNNTNNSHYEVISESNAFINWRASATINCEFARSTSDGAVYTDNNSLYESPNQQGTQVYNPGDAEFANKPSIPYTYELIAPATMMPVVIANAGRQTTLDYTPVGDTEEVTVDGDSVEETISLTTEP